MRTTGFVVRIGRSGWVHIPAELRQLLGISVGDTLTVNVDGELIVLKKCVYVPTCVFCAGVDGIECYRGKLACRRCVAEAFGVFGEKRRGQKC